MSYSHSEHEVAPAQVGHGEAVSHIEPDDIGVGMLTVLFAFVAIVVLLVVVLLQAWFYNWKVEILTQWPAIDVQQAPAAIAQRQLERIETYGWADRKTQTRAIPVSRAMELVAKELASPSKESEGK
jgi:hypothetical protein